MTGAPTDLLDEITVVRFASNPILGNIGAPLSHGDSWTSADESDSWDVSRSLKQAARSEIRGADVVELDMFEDTSSERA